MRDPGYGWSGLAAASVGLALLAYMATCGIARATEHEIRWRHEDPTRPAAAIRVCQLERCVDVPTTCAPGATCSTVVDLEPGVWPTTARVAALAAGPWSLPSNVLEIRVPMLPADCLQLDACRFDADGDGTTTAADFARFLRVFGTSWP